MTLPMYNENSLPADPLDTSYVAVITEWLGGGLPSTDHHVSLSVHGFWSREASDRKSNKFEEKSNIIWRNPIERRTYLLKQLDDLSNNNNNKISALTSYEWTDGYEGLSQKDETEDEQIVDDVTSGKSHDVMEDGFVLIDGLSYPKDIAVSEKYLPGSEEIHRGEIFLNSLFVDGRTQNQPDNLRFESETELEREHFWKSEADVKKPSSKSESVSLSFSKDLHHKYVADHSVVTSPSITNYEDDMKLFFQANDPSTDHFHLFTMSGGMENESGKSRSAKQVSSNRFTLKPIIQKRLLIQVNDPDWEFPTLSMHKRDDSKYSSILSSDNNLPEEISTTGNYSANKTNDVSITTTAGAFTSAHSVHIPGNVQIKAKPVQTDFESTVAEELTNIFESGKKEVDKELGIPDFEFSETKSKKETTKGSEGHTSDKKGETSQMEKTQSIFLPDFDFDDTGILGSKTKSYDNEYSTNVGKTKAKVETPTTPTKSITAVVKEHSKVGDENQGNIDLPSFGFMNLSGEIPAVSSDLSKVSTSTLVTSQKSETTAFENLVSLENTNNIIRKQDVGLQLHGQDYNAKVQTSEVSEKVKGKIPGGKAEKESHIAQIEIVRNIALSDFDFDEDLKTNQTEAHFQSKPTGEVKTKEESIEHPSMTNTTVVVTGIKQITQIKTEGRDRLGKDKEKNKKKNQKNIELPNFGFEDLTASSASLSISAFEKLPAQERTNVIESGKKVTAKQMEIPDFNQKVTKDVAAERINEATEIENMAEINLPDFEFDETIAATTTAAINKRKKSHVTSDAQTIETVGVENEKLTREGKLENLEKTTQGHVIIPSFDFENLSSREAASPFSSSMTFSSVKSKVQEGNDSMTLHKVPEEHAELMGNELKSPLVTTQVSSKSVDGKFPKRSESPQRGTDDNSAVSTQITTSVITISKAPQSPEKSHPKTSIKLISRAESYEKNKEATAESKEKKQDLQNITFDKPDYQGSPKQAEGGQQSVDSNKFQLPTSGLDSHLPGENKMYSIVADEEIVTERDSKLSGKPKKVSESTPETGNFTMIPFFKLKSNEGDEELETESTDKETPNEISRETATDKNIKIEFPTFGFGSITTHAETIDLGANETKEDETTEIPDNHDKNETTLMQTGIETKFGSKALPDESILNAEAIESYVNKILESAVNSIKQMDVIEKQVEKSNVDDEDNGEGEEDIVVPYSKLKDEDEDDEENDEIKFFKKTIDTDGYGNIVTHKKGSEGTKQQVDEDYDYDFDQKSGKVHLPGGDDDEHEFLVDVTRSTSERLRNLTRDLVVERPPLTSTSSVEIVITPATPIDRSVAISDDWYGKLNETSLIEEEKMEEKRARQMADEMQKPNDDSVACYEAEDEEDDEDAENRKNVLTYDDDDMKIYDVDNDGDDDDDDDDDDSNTDDDSSGPFSSYKREVIRISFDDDDSGDDARKHSTSSSEDRINPGLYSPKNRFSLENIETIVEENETAPIEDPFSPSDHETVTPGILGATLERDAGDLISVSLPRFQVGDVELGNAVSKVSESAGSASITTSTDVAVTTPTSEATISSSSRNRVAETSLPSYDASLHSFNVTDQKPVTPLEQNIIIPATIATAVAVTEVVSTTSSGQQNDLDILIPVAKNVRSSEKIYTSTDHSGMNINLPRVGLHSTPSSKKSEENDVSVATTTAPTSSATVTDVALFSTAIGSDDVVADHEGATASTSSTTDVREIGGRIMVGSLLSTFDIEVIPDSSVPADVTENENWPGNTEITESETKLEQKDFGTFDDNLNVEDDIKIPLFDIESRTNLPTSDSNSLDVKEENQESEKIVKIEIPFFDVGHDLKNPDSELPIAEVKGQGKDVTSFPSDAFSITTSEAYIPRASGNTQADNILTTTSSSSAEEAIETGERLLLGSLLSTVDVNIIPASPVPPSVMEDENWFGNVDINKKETNIEQQDFGALDEDIEIEEKIQVPFFDIESNNNNSDESKTGFGQIEIPFFDIKGDDPNDLSLPEVEVKDGVKLVTQPSVQTTSSPAKALDISTQFFNVPASTAPLPATLTSSSIEGISLPSVSPLISENQKSSEQSSENDNQDHLDEVVHGKGITGAGGNDDEIPVTDQDDIFLKSGALKRKRSNVKGELADGEEDDDEEFMTKRSSSSIVKSYNTGVTVSSREYNDSYVAEKNEDDISEDIKDFDIGKEKIGHSIEAPEFSQEKQIDLTQEENGKAKLQEMSTFGIDYQSKVITSGEELPKSPTNESETYDENIRRLDSLLEHSRRELDVLRPGPDKNETADEDGKPHQASKEEEKFLLDTTLDQSLTEFRDISSVMSPGSDFTEDSPTIGWRSTGKVHQIPLDNLLDSSALESPVESGEVRVGRRTLDDNWLDTSTETSESTDKFQHLPDQIPIGDEEKLTHSPGPIRKKDNVPVDSRMTDGSSTQKSITPSSYPSSAVTFAKPSSRDNDDDDDLRFSSEIDWSIKARQSDENKVGHHVTSMQASSPSSIQKVTTTATTTRVMSDSLSSDLVSESNDLTQKSGQQDSQQEKASTDIRQVVDKNQEIERNDFKALHEKSLKEIQSGVESNQSVKQENVALFSKEITESVEESASKAPESEPKSTNPVDGGIKTGSSAAESALETLLSDAERIQIQVEMSNEEKTEPSLIIYSPGGDVAKVQDNIKGMSYAASNANDGIQLKQVLPEIVEVSSDKSSNIKIEVRDLDKYQEKDSESSSEGKIIYIAPSSAVTLHAAKDQQPIEPIITEECVNVDKSISEKENSEVVKNDGNGIKIETATAKPALETLLSDAEKIQVQVEMSSEMKTEPSLINYSLEEDVAKVQDHLERFGQAGGPTQVDVVDTEQVSSVNVIVDSSDRSSNKNIEARDLDKYQEKDSESSTEGKIIFIAPSSAVTQHATKVQQPIEPIIAEECVNVDKSISEKKSSEVVNDDDNGLRTATSTDKSNLEAILSDRKRILVQAEMSNEKKTEPSLITYSLEGDVAKVQDRLERFGQAGGPTQVDVVGTEQVSSVNAIVDSSDKSSDKKIEVRDLDKSQEKDHNLSAEGHISLVSPPAKVTLHTVKDQSPIDSMIAGGNMNTSRAKPRSGAGIEEIISGDGGRKAESSTGSTPVYSIREESEDASNWKEVIIADSKHLVDMKAIEPYKKCVAHGGYYGNGLNAVIVFYACHLPPKTIPNYTYVMDNLFYYIMNVLEVIAVDQYKLVYLHGTMTEAKLPPNKWMKKCYETIDRKLKKRMEQMLVVHPTFWLKTLIFLFASSKFSKKLVYIKSLADLNKLFPSEDLQIPEEVVEVDHKLNPPKKRSK